MGCSSSKALDIREVKSSIRGSSNKVVFRKTQKVIKGETNEKPVKNMAHQKVIKNVDIQSGLSPATWPELNILLCKLKQETPMFNAKMNGDHGTKTIREVINTSELMQGLEDDEAYSRPLKTRPRARRTRSVSAIHTVEELDAVTEKKSVKTSPQDDMSVHYKDLAENIGYKGFADNVPCTDSSEAVSEKQMGAEDLKPSTVNNGDQYTVISDGTVFYPELLESFVKALEEVSENEWFSGNQTEDHSVNSCNIQAVSSSESRNTVATEKEKEQEELLRIFEPKCPPNGENKAVLYTTSLRGIRKTYEDCQTLKLIVESYGVGLDERDVSMHSGFLQELKSLTEQKAGVPRLFVRGRYIGGSEDVMELHDDGKLGKLFYGLPTHEGGRKSCEGCGGLRFFPCLKCNGSCKVLEEGGLEASRCSDCNENGLVQCPLCSSSSPSSSVCS